LLLPSNPLASFSTLLSYPFSMCPMINDAQDSFPINAWRSSQSLPGHSTLQIVRIRVIYYQHLTLQAVDQFPFLQMAPTSWPKMGWPSAFCCLFKLPSPSTRLAKSSAAAVSLGCPRSASHLVILGK
jgi:hypothetical protein